jgi:hypothetical protein
MASTAVIVNVAAECRVLAGAKSARLACGQSLKAQLEPPGDVYVVPHGNGDQASLKAAIPNLTVGHPAECLPVILRGIFVSPLQRAPAFR